jgi:hypothetical protein
MTYKGKGEDPGKFGARNNPGSTRMVSEEPTSERRR